MIDLQRMAVDGAVLSILASAWILFLLRLNPRLFLQDFPKDLRDRLPPKTPAERRMSLWLGVPFLILLVAVPTWSAWAVKREHAPDVTWATLALQAFGVAMIFNLVDLLILDWLLVCAITPRFIVLPGTEGMAGYKDYWHHFRGFLIGTVISAVMGSLIGAAISVL